MLRSARIRLKRVNPYFPEFNEQITYAANKMSDVSYSVCYFSCISSVCELNPALLVG